MPDPANRDSSGVSVIWYYSDILAAWEMPCGDIGAVSAGWPLCDSAVAKDLRGWQVLAIATNEPLLLAPKGVND